MTRTAKDHRSPVADAEAFGLLDALRGRRSRRFPAGAAIPDGPLAYTSTLAPRSLSRDEQDLLVDAVAGRTGWQHLMAHHDERRDHMPNWSLRADGRSFPSSAGFHTSRVLVVDDGGIHVLDEPAPTGDGRRAVLRRVEADRLRVPPAAVQPHNRWAFNRPGTTLVIPVADAARHLLAKLLVMAEMGVVVEDDVHGRPLDLPSWTRSARRLPLSYVEERAVGELAAELATACFAGMLVLQAIGLGGWMFHGVDRHTLLVGSGPEAPGLGFQALDTPRHAPTATGRDGVLAATCPPHLPDMRTATRRVVEAKFGPGGPYHPATPGPYRDTAGVRGAATRHPDEVTEVVASTASQLHRRAGRFPVTFPSVYVLTLLQAHHLDLGFYDHHFAPGAYLETHRHHLERWHPDHDEETT